MANTGRCCASLEMPKALMKMGLSMVLVGHVNFLLGALVHGAVLRHINLNTRARTVAYSISNVVALTTGLVGVVVGILAIILSKNKKSRVLTWSLFVVSLLGSLLATASAIGLTVSVVRATVNGGHSLLAHCRFPNAIGYASITNECPFDPTHVYSMTLILWVPLIVTCIVQLVFSAWCFSVCVSFLGLPCFPHKIRLRDHGRTINTVAPAEKPSLTSSVPAHPLHLHLLQSVPSHLKSQQQPLPPHLHHSDPSHLKSQRQPLPPPHHLHHSNPSHLKSQRQPLPPLPHLHHSNPSHLKSQRQPLPPPHHLHHSDPSHLKSQRQPLPPPHHLHHSNPSHLKSQWQPLPPHLHHSNPSHLKSQWQPLPPPHHLHHSDPSHLKSQWQPLPPHLHHSNLSHLKSQQQPLPHPPHLHHSNPSHLRSQRQPLPPPHLHHSNPSHLKSQRQPLRPQHQNQRGRSDRRSDGWQLVPPEEHELLEQGSQQRPSFWI